MHTGEHTQCYQVRSLPVSLSKTNWNLMLKWISPGAIPDQTFAVCCVTNYSQTPQLPPSAPSPSKTGAKYLQPSPTKQKCKVSLVMASNQLAEDAVLHSWPWAVDPVWAGKDLLSYIIIPVNESASNQHNEDFSSLSKKKKNLNPIFPLLITSAGTRTLKVTLLNRNEMWWSSI